MDSGGGGVNLQVSTVSTLSFDWVYDSLLWDAGVCRRLARTPRVPLAPEGRGRVCEGGTGRK